MAKYRKVSLGLWADEKVRRLSRPTPNGQSLLVWLITGTRTTQIPGIVLGTPEELAAALRWPFEGFWSAMVEIVDQDMAKVDREAGMVWLPNGAKHNAPESPNVVRSWRATWDETPECPLKIESWHALKAFTEGLGEGFAKAFREACTKPFGKPSAKDDPEQEQEQEQEQEHGDPAPPILKLGLVPSKPVFDYEAIYRAYPRKDGKSRGLALCEKQIRTAGDYAALKVAVANYAIQVQDREAKYQKHFSTFMGCWRDYITVERPPEPIDRLMEDHAAGRIR